MLRLRSNFVRDCKDFDDFCVGVGGYGDLRVVEKRFSFVFWRPPEPAKYPFWIKEVPQVIVRYQCPWYAYAAWDKNPIV